MLPVHLVPGINININRIVNYFRAFLFKIGLTSIKTALFLLVNYKISHKMQVYNMRILLVNLAVIP